MVLQSPCSEIDYIYIYIYMLYGHGPYAMNGQLPSPHHISVHSSFLFVSSLVRYFVATCEFGASFMSSCFFLIHWWRLTMWPTLYVHILLFIYWPLFLVTHCDLNGESARARWRILPLMLRVSLSPTNLLQLLNHFGCLPETIQ